MKFSFSSRYIINYSLLAVIFLAGCDTSETALLTEKSIIYCSEGSPESFNPQTVTSGTTIDATAYQLYNRLLSFDSQDNSLIPELAKSWHITKDGTKVTFYLRKDVQFHDTDYFTPTRVLNADDVIFSFERILEQDHPYHQVSGGRYPFFNNNNFASIVERIEKINDFTIRFHLTGPNKGFLSSLATDYAVILSAEYADQLALQSSEQNIDIYPIGTGPFKFQEYRAGSFIRYYRHQDYWQSPALIQQLLFDITPNNTGRLTKLLASECDIVAYPIAHQTIDQHPALSLDQVTAYNVAYFGFNTQKPPFDNKLVRQAVAYAINKDAIMDAVYYGQAERAKSLLPPSAWDYEQSVNQIDYSIAKAQELLAEAGIEPGSLTIDIWAMPVQRAYNPDAVTMAKLIQADLQNIGINSNIVSYEWATFLKRLSNGEHQSVLIGWTADYADPDNFFTPLLSCSSARTGTNRALWCNDEFDQLLADALATSSSEQRRAYYQQAIELIAQEVPLVPIAHSKRFQARSSSVQGLVLDPFGGIDFTKVTKN